MKFEGFVGGSYQSYSLVADNQRTINLFPELIESGNGRSKAVLYGTPGLSTLASVPEQPHRGIVVQDSRCFVVAGGGFYEIALQGGSVTRIGEVAGSGPVSIASSGLSGGQLAFVADGTGYVFTLSSNTLATISAAGFPADPLQIVERDGTFFVLTRTGRMQASALLDATSWTASNFGTRSHASDSTRAWLWTREIVYLLGEFTSEGWYDAGTSGFPLAAANGYFLEMGIAARGSLALFNQQATWLAQDSHGGRYVVQAEGASPKKISTHAVDRALQSYARIDDAVGWAENHQGHEFYVLTSPSWPTTWVYDASTSLWHERCALVNGSLTAARPITHAWTGSMHLVGDRSTGALYQQSVDLYDDAGSPLPAIRQSPIVADGDRMVWCDRLALIADTGLGISTDSSASPKVNLRWSDDSGKTWGNSLTANLGPLGAPRQRVEWRRLGGTRYGRVFEVSMTDAVKRAWIDAELDVTRGTH
jgi:hypothetical protein